MDDATVYRDYHLDKMDEKNKEIAVMKEERDSARAELWLASRQRDNLRVALESISRMPEDPVWRDDWGVEAAEEMILIAEEALSRR